MKEITAVEFSPTIIHTKLNLHTNKSYKQYRCHKKLNVILLIISSLTSTPTTMKIVKMECTYSFMVFVLKSFLWSVFSLRNVRKKNWNSYNLLMIVINTFLYNKIIHSSFIYWFTSMEKIYSKNGLIHNW